MADERPIHEPGELIYGPRPSWYPALIAAGLAAVIASLFTWWPYGAIGAVVALVALRAWIGEAREDFGRLPRTQHLTSAPIPATILRRR
ncbi:MAG: hypothetical protein ACREGK_01940 [Geminicoccales bacterium]